MTGIDTTETKREAVERELNEYVARATARRERDAAISQWHTDAFLSQGLPLPYLYNETYISLTVYDYDNLNENGSATIDTDATTAALAKVVKFARLRGLKVEKLYGETVFSLQIKVPYGNDVPNKTFRLTYSADRVTVCERKVVGTKVTPAQYTPEKVEDLVEWECNKISFLATDTEEVN